MTEAPPLAATTLHDINAFCNESRDLAAAINAYANRWEHFMSSHRPPITAKSRRKVELSMVVLESAIERLRN